MEKKKTTVYISYAGGDINSEDEIVREREEIVNTIEKELKKHFHVERDKSTLEFRKSIPEFMEKIGKGEFVVVVISKKYLTKSGYTLREIREIVRNSNLKDRVYIVRTEHAPDIFSNAQVKQEILEEARNTIEDIQQQIVEEIEGHELAGIFRECETELKRFLREIIELKNFSHTEEDIKKLVETIYNDSKKKNNDYRIWFIIISIILILGSIGSYFYGENKGIKQIENTITLSKKLKNEIETLSYKIRHTKNDSELIDLKKKLQKKEKRLERITLIHEMDTNKEISKILERNGTKAAYDYATTNTQNIKIENDEKKLSNRQYTRAILAFEMQKFEESNTYCRKAMLNYPAFKVNIWCSASLVMQDKKNEGFKVLSETLKLPYLKDEEKAMIYTQLVYSDKTKFKMYFEKAIEIYKNKDLNKYYSTLIEYSGQLLVREDKTYLEFLNILDDELGHFSNNADLMFEYWQLKAKYNRNINNGEEAVVSIMQADKYKNNIVKSTDIRISQYLVLKTTIFKEQNEIKYLEKLYLDNLEYALNSAKKFPNQINHASLVFKEVIGFYDEQHNYKKQEELFVKWAKFLKDYCTVEDKLPISRYSDFLLHYEIFLTLNNYFKKSNIIINFSKKLQLIKDKNITKMKNENVAENHLDLFQKKKNINSKFNGINWAFKFQLNHKEKVEIQNQIVKHIETINTLERNSIKLSIPEKEFFKYLNMSGIAMNYLKLGMYDEMLKWYKKANIIITKLSEKNVQRYGYYLITSLTDILNFDRNNSTMYGEKIERTIKKLMKKNRQKYLNLYALNKMLKCSHEKSDGIQEYKKAEESCNKSLDAVEELEKNSYPRYINHIKNIYGYLIDIERHKENANRDKIKYYKLKRREIKDEIKAISSDTSGRNFNLILGYLDEIVECINNSKEK